MLNGKNTGTFKAFQSFDINDAMGFWCISVFDSKSTDFSEIMTFDFALK